jgi:hypothetical protein
MKKMMICDRAKECKKLINCEGRVPHIKSKDCKPLPDSVNWCGGKCVPVEVKS